MRFDLLSGSATPNLPPLGANRTFKNFTFGEIFEGKEPV
jgi:hypothetical protein